ncbi:subtilisin-like serine protease [Owenweeksia hongkongensis DSM 17368]|uniref:Subtilisin-like serine protease n=1 Tax=Owenweeksia hongkongensis (strain DSM 17368 / CIP 108786 / JCM 12287 / NRRL B-23963 / UST20020801) TaxID=926562 RepID=G8QZP4_OWEHD|nr:S8 family serine peptidase [Owenweeksia hongkongensis]AEV33697.1 subtilisin-like serine protease [Owenweeksia hongkongensis DSM 17368]
MTGEVGIFFHNNNNVADDTTTNAHGTGVAGILGARSNNYIGIAGVSGGWGSIDGVKVMNVKMGEPGVANINANANALDDAIVYAVENGAHILNMSLRVSTNFVSINEAIEFAYNDSNCVLVAGSGNHTGTANPVDYPANNPLVISVASTNTQDRTENCGTGPDLDLGAPGISVPMLKVNDEYEINRATSTASPFAAGIAGLMLSINPCLDNEEVGNVLKRRADQVHKNNPINPYNYNTVQTKTGHSNMAGYGRVNAKRAVNTAEAMKKNTLDLYIKDHYSDFGFPQSYPDTSRFDDWSDIWVRNQADGRDSLQMEEIEYSSASPAYVYVRVRNKSCVASNGSDTLNLYWTKSSSGNSWPQNWDGTDTTVGNIIGSVRIPPLAAGEDSIFEFPWTIVPQNVNHWGICLMARIASSADPIVPNPDLSVEIRSNNNIAARNLKVMDIFPGREHPYFEGKEYPYGIKILSGTFANTPALPVELRFDVPYGITGGTLVEEAEIKLFLSEELWQIFLNTSSSDREGIDVVGEKELLITSPHARIRNLIFDENERHWFFFGFNFLTEEVTETYSYRYHITELIDNEIKGSMNFNINREPREEFEADAGPDQYIYQGQSTQAQAVDINENATYNWYDSSDSLIYSGKTPTLSPTVTEQYKLEVIAEADLYKDYDEMVVQVNPYAITALNPNPASTNLTIDYDADEANSAYLIVQPVVGGGSNNYIISTSQNQTSINVSSYAPGVYAILLVCDGIVVDSEMLTIQ